VPADVWERTPSRRSFVGDCARAIGGRRPADAAAPPRRPMNSRRLTRPPDLSPSPRGRQGSAGLPCGGAIAPFRSVSSQQQ
jgi:hypothetical protein